MSKRKQHAPEFKAKVALEAQKGRASFCTHPESTPGNRKTGARSLGPGSAEARATLSGES